MNDLDLSAGTISVTVPAPDDAPAIVDLPPGTLPCRVCGVAVEQADAAAVAEPIVREKYGHEGRLVSQDVQPAVMCRACLAINNEAHRMVPLHLLLGVRFQRVVDTLYALDALGGPAPTFIDADDLVALINHLPAAGMVAFGGGAKVGTAAVRRWSHVSDGLRRTLREGAARWMKERLEVPAPFAPPIYSERRGCLFCGIGTVMALPSRSAEVWTEAYVSVSQLGGGNGATGAVDGHVCPACATAIATTDGGGIAALQAAVLAFIGYQRTNLTPIQLTGLRGWGLRSDTTPNRTPWAHVDLAGLRREVAAFERGAVS